MKFLPEKTSQQQDDIRQLLNQCERSYASRQEFLRERERNREFYMGDQWSDTMEHPDTGKEMTEREYILSEGRYPVQNNQIETIVRSFIGQFRANLADPVAFARNKDDASAGETVTAALKSVSQLNDLDDVIARQIEEFGVSAGIGFKIDWRWWGEQNEENAFIEGIDQTRFFFNSNGTDHRFNDVWLVGEIHDMSFDDILAAFGQSPADYDRLKEIVPDNSDMEGWYREQFGTADNVPNFYMADDPSLHRVIEVWREEREWQFFIHDEADATYTRATPELFVEEFGVDPVLLDEHSYETVVNMINEQRLQRAIAQEIDPNSVPQLSMDQRYEGIFKVYYLTANGDVLFEAETPFEHGSHPYVFSYYPMIDGRAHSLVSSVVDQQKLINRLISMMDKTLGESAKNLMWVPDSAVPSDMERQEFADQSVVYNGMMFYDANEVADVPQPIRTNSNMAGAKELLQLQINLMQDITAINNAVQGQAPKSQTPASLYAQQIEQASINNKDYYDHCHTVVRRLYRKIIQVLLQYYTEKRYIRVSGTGFQGSSQHWYDPDTVEGIDFDVAIGEAQNTLAYRQTVDNYLMEFLKGGMINFRQFLETTSLPFADTLLQSLDNQQEGMALQAGMPQQGQPQQGQGVLNPQQGGGQQPPEPMDQQQIEQLAEQMMRNTG